MPEEEEHFEFVDKRRTARPAGEADERSAAGPAASAGGAGQRDAEEEASRHPRLVAADRILMCIDILQQGAWIALGLVEDPVTNKVERNLDDAKILIDGVASLAENVEPLVDESAQRELRNLVAMLRMNFVNQARRG